MEYDLTTQNSSNSLLCIFHESHNLLIKIENNDEFLLRNQQGILTKKSVFAIYYLNSFDFFIVKHYSNIPDNNACDNSSCGI